MKAFLKFAGVFALGVAIGAGVSGYFTADYFINKITRDYKFQTVADISKDIMFLRMYRERSGDRFLKVIEDGIPEYILTIEKDEVLKNSGYYKMILGNAKMFYHCTQTPVPKEIEEIINKVESSGDLDCETETKEINESGEEK